MPRHAAHQVTEDQTLWMFRKSHITWVIMDVYLHRESLVVQGRGQVGEPTMRCNPPFCGSPRRYVSTGHDIAGAWADT
eukprot:972994-Rhodomonas_salina.1